MNIKRNIPISKSLLLKISSLLLGYTVWYTLSSNTMVTQSVIVPVYCYNQKEHHTLETPEAISLTLKAPRSFMRLVDHTTLGVHIDAHQLHEGKNYLCLSYKELLLPQEIGVSHDSPVLIVDTQTS